MHSSLANPVNTTSINLWKVAGAFIKPKGIFLEFHSPEYVMNAVFS